MATNREIELKYSLTEPEYRRLRRRISGTTAKFTNTFFDTPDLALRRHGIGCRIRIIPGKSAVLTIKYGGGSQGGLHERIELECNVEASRARRLLTGIASLSSLSRTSPVEGLLRLVGVDAVRKLRPLGGLSTTRTKFRFSGLTGELDRCLLKGSYFYELEIESATPKQADEKTRDWLEAQGIPIRPETRTKLSRFFASLRR